MAVFRHRTLRKNPGRPVFFRLDEQALRQAVLNAESVFFFLDLDGTLVEIAATPAEVSLNPWRRRCLEQLSSARGFSVAIVSGRKTEELQHVVGLKSVFYVGLHGLEMVLPQGGKISYPLSEPLKDALQSLREQFAGSFADTPGIFVEDKGSALALHFRLATKEAASRVIRDFAEAVNAHQRRGLPLEVLKGKGVIEVKPMAMNKGRAIAHILDRYGKMALPIYVGDDVTDEAAFHVVGRRGIAILVSEAPRKTAARFYLRGPDDVYTFLKDLIFLRAQKP